MAITITQAVAGTNVQATSQTIALSALGANPNILDFLATFAAKAGGTSSASDTVNSVHTRKVVDTGTQAALFAKLGSAAGTPTVTVSPDSLDWFGCGAVEFAGVSVTDDGNAQNDGTGTTQTAGTIATTASGIVFGLCSYYSATRPTPSAGWTELLFATDLGFQPYSLVYQITSASGSYTPTWTTGASIAYWAASVAFKDSAAPPSGTPFFTTIGAQFMR